MPLIFLDFDGVLRRLSSEPSRFDADCLGHFEGSIRARTDVRVVVSSTWRLGMPLRGIRTRFSPDVRTMIAGVTPEAPRLTPHYRYHEILTYLRNKASPSDSWIAIDDDPEHFPPEAPTLLTDPDRGFDTLAAKRLQTWLDEHRVGWVAVAVEREGG